MNSVLDLPEFEGYRLAWAARCARYQTYRAYYAGTAYDDLRSKPNAKQLYAGTRTLFTPIRRAVRVDVAKVPGAWSLNEQATSQATRDRVAELRKLTDAERVYQRYTRYAGVVGEAAMMLAGTPEEPKPVALRADEVVLGTMKDGRTPFALIIKKTTASSTLYLGQVYLVNAVATEYAQLITPTEIVTYQDGVEKDYDGLGSRRPNAFGFVPVHFGSYLEGEDGCGEPAFAGVLELLDRVNEIASLTLDTIARNAEPKIVGTGVSELEVDEEHDAILIENKDAKLFTLDPKLQIADTLAFIQDVRGEFKTLLPQLSLDELKGISDLAYDTVITLLQELGDHIIAVRTQLDRAVETVEQWMLGASGAGIPEDYALHRDRSWIPLTESQQLDLEGKRLVIEGQRLALTRPAPTSTPAQPGADAGNQETTPHATDRGAAAAGAGAGDEHPRSGAGAWRD